LKVLKVCGFGSSTGDADRFPGSDLWAGKDGLIRLCGVFLRLKAKNPNVMESRISAEVYGRHQG
jgi:hypothetical protein